MIEKPDKIGELLHRLESAGIRAAVSGGWLRDVYCGKTPKDIDVFVDFMGRETHALLASSVLIDITGLPVSVESTLGMYKEGEVARIFSAGEMGGVPVQIIELHEGLNPKTRWKHNDFGICQIAMFIDDAGRLTIEKTPAFIRDAMEQTFTLVHCENEQEHARSMRRWERLREKYVGHCLVDFTIFAKGE